MPLLVYSYNVTLIDSSLAVTCAAAGVPCARSPADTVLRVSVTPVVYLTALVAFVGWYRNDPAAPRSGAAPPARSPPSPPLSPPLCAPQHA